MKIILTLLLLSISSIQAAETSTPQTLEITIPDPLDLKKDWWEFFEASPAELTERCPLFKERLNLLKASLKPQEHQETLQLIERLGLEIDVLIKKKSETIAPLPSPMQFLSEYTIKQLLEVQNRILRLQSLISNLKDKIEGHKSSILHFKGKLDLLLVNYPAIANASKEKLSAGLEIIEKKLELAIQNTGLTLAQGKLEAFQKEREHLQQELKLSKEKISLKEENPQNLAKTLAHLEKEIDLSCLKEHQLEKQVFYQDQTNSDNDLSSCLWDFKLLTQSVKGETLQIQALMVRIKMALLDNTNASDLLKDWKKEIASAQSRLKKWNDRVEENRAKVSQLAKGKPVTEIHEELDNVIAKLEDFKFQIKHAELLNGILESRLIKEAPLGDVWKLQLSLSWTTIVEWFSAFSTYVLFHIHDQPITLVTFLKALSFIAAAFIFSRYLQILIEKRKIFSKVCTPSTQYIILRCLHYGFILIGCLLALAYIGLDFTNLAIVAGALGIGIGFGLQSMVNNIVSGFALLLQRHIKVGDKVELGEQFAGIVQSINLQNTHIKSFEGADIIVPNADLSGQRLLNWTMRDPCRRVRIPFGVCYGVEKENLKKVALEAAMKVPGVIKNDPRFPDPQLWFIDYGENAMQFELVCWVDTNISVPHETHRSAILWELDQALKAHKITMPYPLYEWYYKTL